MKDTTTKGGGGSPEKPTHILEMSIHL